MKYRLNEDYLWKEIGQQVVILHFQSGVYWTLNETASVIWKQLIETNMSEQDSVQAMTQLFDIDEKTAAQDIHDFIAQCLEKKVLQAL